MEVEKRKRRSPDDGKVLDGKRSKAREDNGVKTAVDDDEVEEFFAILRRIHVAVDYFKKVNGESGRGLTAWSSSFNWEDIEEVNGVKGPEGVEKSISLDLNADPETKSESV